MPSTTTGGGGARGSLEAGTSPAKRPVLHPVRKDAKAINKRQETTFFDIELLPIALLSAQSYLVHFYLSKF
jgi:hypothetical protein